MDPGQEIPQWTEREPVDFSAEDKTEEQSRLAIVTDRLV